ncbi:MAG: sugar ABC transporter permease [Defluviitaleaceae bacterium]|nr:sugar ABC transporter permease [Defluviitaleaceae bacterium]
MSMVSELKTLLSKNIRDYGMFIALIVIAIVFNILTDGLFLSPRNVSNLVNATGYIAVLAVGMTLVIVIRHIDLSVGFLAGLCGAVVALLMVQQGFNMFLAVPIVLVIGLAAGLVSGFFVAKVGVPAFVISLAGMLIFRGMLLQATAGTGTISLPNHTHAQFNAIGNGFIPDWIGGLFAFEGIYSPVYDGRILYWLANSHLMSLLVGLIAIVLMVVFQLKARNDKVKYGFAVLSWPLMIGKMLLMAIGIGYITFVLSGHNGISWTVVIVIVVVAVYHFITTKTVLGRHIYAVGSNPEAAKLSGINVSKITFFVFGSMGMLAALSGVLFTARLQSATPTAGTLFELDAIAAAYVGGVSAGGGVGKVTGSIIGALVMASLPSGMNLMGIGISYQFIVRGLVLIAAVTFDVMSRNRNR